MNHLARGLPAALLALALAGAAVGSPVPPDPVLMSMPPAVRAMIARHPRSQPHAAVNQAAADVTPPVIVSVSVGTSFDATAPYAILPVHWSATDDLSGVTDALATFAGPDGQQAYAYLSLGDDYGLRTIDTQVPMDSGPFMVAGTWTLTTVMAWDVAGNRATYDASTLASVGGNHQFTVVNRFGGDAQPPTLVKGSLRTSVRSASDRVPGTSVAAPVVAYLRVTDTATGLPSGTAVALAYFCTATESSCMLLSSPDVGDQRAQPTLLPLTGTVSWVPPGDYELVSVTLMDRARNHATYTSTQFGGTTDFSTYFDTPTTITVTP